MPTASTASRRPPRARRASHARRPTAVAALACVLLAGCIKRPAVLVDADLLEPMRPETSWLPSASDRAAVELARVALVAPPPPTLRARQGAAGIEIERALAAVKAATTEETGDRLLPLATDLRNATLDDPIGYRRASRSLKRRFGLDPRLRSRLSRTVEDDPIRLAVRRQLDGWHTLWARTFNAVSEPLGNSLITGFVIAPFQLANSITHYFAEFSNREALSLTGRQALAHRKDFLGRHPDTELTPKLERQIAKGDVKLARTLAHRRVRAADNAYDSGEWLLSSLQAEAAERILSEAPDHNRRLRRKAHKLAVRAGDRLDARHARRARSLEARASEPTTRDAELRLASSLLAGPVTLAGVDPLLRAYLETGGSRDRAEFVLALAQHEMGFERASRERIARLAAGRVDRDPMVRHARAIENDAWQNPFPRLRRAAAVGAARGDRLSAGRRVGEATALSEPAEADRLPRRRAHHRDDDRDGADPRGPVVLDGRTGFPARRLAGRLPLPLALSRW